MGKDRRHTAVCAATSAVLQQMIGSEPPAGRQSRPHVLYLSQALCLAAFCSPRPPQGIALLSCVAGCTCNSSLVNAHQPTARVSVEATFVTEVSQAEHCTIELRISNMTTSGEHKWKLLGLGVRAPGSPLDGKMTLGGLSQRPKNWAAQLEREELARTRGVRVETMPYETAPPTPPPPPPVSVVAAAEYRSHHRGTR